MHLSEVMTIYTASRISEKSNFKGYYIDVVTRKGKHLIPQTDCTYKKSPSTSLTGFFIFQSSTITSYCLGSKSAFLDNLNFPVFGSVPMIFT